LKKKETKNHCAVEVEEASGSNAVRFTDILQGDMPYQHVLHGLARGPAGSCTATTLTAFQNPQRTATESCGSPSRTKLSLQFAI
jgi:hypothetical protein